MKCAMLLLFVFLMSGSFAQEREQGIGAPSFKINSANSLKADTVKESLTFSGNVQLESEKLQVQADEIFIDQKTNTIVATGLKKMCFNGRVVFKGGSVHHTLRYTLGNDEVFIE